MQIQRLAVQDGDIPRRLIEAASEAFARHGFAGTRVRDIVRAADVNLASVNYYFGGKEGLYAATLKELASQRQDSFPATPASPRAETIEESLARHVLAILERFVQGDGESNLGRILAHESMNPTAYFDLLVADIMRPEIERVRALVLRATDGRIEPEDATRATMGILGQCLFYLFARGAVEKLHPRMQHDREAREALARHIARFSLGGLAALAPG